MLKPLLCRRCRQPMKRGNGGICILCKPARGRKSISMEIEARARSKRLGLKYYE